VGTRSVATDSVSVVSGKSTETAKCEARAARRLSCRRREIFWSIRREIARKPPPSVRFFTKIRIIIIIFALI
jgi:hypothetical protein